MVKEFYGCICLIFKYEGVKDAGITRSRDDSQKLESAYS